MNGSDGLNMQPRALPPDPAYPPGIAGVASIKVPPTRFHVNRNGIPDTSGPGPVMLQQPTRWNHDFDPDTGMSRASLISESPIFDNHPLAPTAPAGTSDTTLATTEFVMNAGAGTVAEAVAKARIGVTNGFNAAPGEIGEYLSITVPTPGLQLANGAVTTLTQIELPPGDWDINAIVGFTTLPVGNASATFIAAMNDIPTFPGFPNMGGAAALCSPQTQVDTTVNLTIRILTATPRTLFLLTYCSWTSGNMWSYGFMGARRRR